MFPEHNLQLWGECGENLNARSFLDLYWIEAGALVLGVMLESDMYETMISSIVIDSRDG